MSEDEPEIEQMMEHHDYLCKLVVAPTTETRHRKKYLSELLELEHDLTLLEGR